MDDLEQRLNTTILWIVLAAASMVFVLNALFAPGREIRYAVSAVAAAIIAVACIVELLTRKRAAVPVAFVIGGVVAVWIVTPGDIDGRWMDTPLLIGPVLLGVLVPRRWRLTAAATVLAMFSLAFVDVALGRATAADAFTRLGVEGIIGAGLIAVVALADAGRRTALAERSALIEASGAAMIRISYEQVIRRFQELRSSGIRTLDAYLDDERAEERLEELIDLIDLRSFNDAALGLYGLSPDEDDFHDQALLPPEVVAVIRRELQAVWDREVTLEHHYEIPLRSGERRWLHQTWNVSFVDGHPDYHNVMVTTLDVTDVKAAEAALEAEVRAKDEFIASVSHELRTPLTAVVGLASELRDSGRHFDEAEAAELIDMIAEQSVEVSHIVEDLLVGARLDSETLSVAFEDIDLTSLVAALEPDVEVEAAGPVRAWADPARVRQIVRNLLVNAERYGGEHRRIRAIEHGDQVVVEVRDDGEAVPETFRAEMFEPYRSNGVQRGLTASVGLGLTVSRRLAELMGGSLEYSYDGESTFALTLPMAPKPHAPTMSATEVATRASSSPVL